MFDVPATSPATVSEPAGTSGKIALMFASEPVSTPLIEHVVSVTVPRMSSVPSAACALIDATPTRPAETSASVERRDFMSVSKKDQKGLQTPLMRHLLVLH